MYYSSRSIFIKHAMLFFRIYTEQNVNMLLYPTSQALGFPSADYANIIKY